jgi:hypothetical protein
MATALGTAERLLALFPGRDHSSGEGGENEAELEAFHKGWKERERRSSS